MTKSKPIRIARTKKWFQEWLKPWLLDSGRVVASWCLLLWFAAYIALNVLAVRAQNTFRDTVRERIRNRAAGANAENIGGFTKCELAGLQCAVWTPEDTTHPVPLVIFSHGFKGSNTQSIFLMKALAKAGYLVVAPNHQDAMGMSNMLSRPETSFVQAAKWNDKTYKSRGDDIVHLLAALKADPKLSAEIDWTKIALAGHSLGGYTALALGGAWPSWKLPEVKAILALSPYCSPFSVKDTLADLKVPVMYQGGTRDTGISPTLKGPNGAFQKTSSPAYFVYFDQFTHFSWTGFNRDQTQKDLVDYYSVAFLNKYVKDDATAKPEAKLPGVVSIEVK